VANGIVRESNSPMCSPLVLVLKGKDGCDGVRLAVDYRYVNSYTIPDAFPVPDIEDVIQRIGSKRYISLFDCRQGYWMTEVREQDRWLTAFVCLGRLLEFTRTPYGMKNSGQSFLRGIQAILRPLRQFADSYVDDCAEFSDEWQSHMQDMEKFLYTIKMEGVTLNFAKCRFAQSSVNFCGEIIGSGLRKIDPENVKALQEMKNPETKKQLRRILGFFGYFRKFLNKFAEKAKVLTYLTAKRVPSNIKPLWKEQHSAALDDLKQELIRASNVSLYIVRLDRLFDCYVDASGYAVSGLLLQKDEIGMEHPIAFFSVKLNPRWSTIEREAYAVLVAVNKYRSWFYGTEITIQ